MLSLGSGHLESQSGHLRLVPGMLANAEIHLGTRSVLEYLLSPVQEVALVACMRKLLVILNAMLKHDIPWHHQLQSAV